MPTRPKKKCVDCNDVHLCKATYEGSKRDQQRTDSSTQGSGGSSTSTATTTKKRGFFESLFDDL